jgi:alpha-N-arabinofuranosidase
VTGMSLQSAQGRVLTADQMTAHNSFDLPEQVRPAVLASVPAQDNKVTLTIPPMSVVVLELRAEATVQP